MNATGSKAETLTLLFGGATNNEGLGLFNLSFDWQYVCEILLTLVLAMRQLTAHFIRSRPFRLRYH